MVKLETEIVDEEAFTVDYHDAKAYYKCALQFKAQGMRPSLAFNTAAIALERYLVAICDLYGEDPRNHNYITLMKTVETVVNVPKELNRRIKAMDWLFGICSIDEYRHPNPDKSDMENVLDLCAEVEKLFDRERIERVKALAQLSVPLSVYN
jgi:hypothetical protein